MERFPEPSDDTGKVIDITLHLITRRAQERAVEIAQDPNTHFPYPTAYDEVVARRQRNIYTRRMHNGGVVEIETPMPQQCIETSTPEPPYPTGA